MVHPVNLKKTGTWQGGNPDGLMGDTPCPLPYRKTMQARTLFRIVHSSHHEPPSIPGSSDFRHATCHGVSRVVDRGQVPDFTERERFLNCRRVHERLSGLRVLSACPTVNHFHILVAVPRRTIELPTAGCSRPGGGCGGLDSRLVEKWPATHASFQPSRYSRRRNLSASGWFGKRIALASHSSLVPARKATLPR